MCAPLRPLLSKSNEGKWNEEHENTFKAIQTAIQKITEIKLF